MKTLINLFLSFLSAVLLTLSFYPYKFGFLIFFAFIPLFFIHRNNTIVKTVFYFTLTALIFYLFHYRWLTRIWSLKFVVLLCFYISLYYGIWAFINKILRINFQNIGEILLSSSIFAILEIIRGNLLGGFTGGTLASSLYGFLPFIQISDIGGIYLVSLIILVINISFYAFLFEMESNKIPILFFMLSVFVLNMIYGYIRIEKFKELAPRVNLSIIQPSIEQEKKWDPMYLGEIIEKLRTLYKMVSPDAEIVIFPETVSPKDLTKYELLSGTFLKLDPLKYLIIGSEYYDDDYFYDWENSKKRNAVFLLKHGKIRDVYYKIRPVPFAEVSPFAFTDRFLIGKPIVPGNTPVVFKTEYGNISVNICFESIFPENSKKFLISGSQLLINVSNEAWFVRNPTSFELLTLSVFRSIEFRRDLVKVSNSGVSAHINSYGKILFKTELFEETVLNFSAELRNNKTFFFNLNYLLIYAIITVSLLLQVFSKKRKIFYL